MKQALTLVCALVVLFAFVSVAMAVGPGKTVQFPNGKQGKVVFDGKSHADAKLTCKDCHPDPFAMKKSVKISKADHDSGKYCFKCHDGKKTFGSKDCAKCHKK